MTAAVEHIKREPQDRDAWVCLCGNEPHMDGFYPCDKNGDEMSPEIGSDWDGLYVCFRCVRIINSDTLEVIGQNPHFKRLE